MRTVIALTAADFTERRRRFSFMAVLALALFAAYCFVPNSNIGALIVEPDIFLQGGHSSWMPTTSAWGISIFMPLLGFLYVSGSLAFDERTGVRQYAVTTPVNHFAYLFSKYISNYLLLVCLICAVFAGSLVMSAIHFPGQALPLYTAVTVFLPFIAASALVSAIAVLFEASRVLSKNIGAVVFIAFWITMIALAMEFTANRDKTPLLIQLLDVTGLSSLLTDAKREVLAQSGRPLQDLNFLAGGARTGAGTATLIFHGIPLTFSQIALWLGQIAVSIALVVLAAPIYAIAGTKKRKLQNKHIDDAPVAFSFADYRPGKTSKRTNLFSGLFAEIKLMLAGFPLLWYLVAVAGMALCAFLPMEPAGIALMVLPVWFIGVFSAMGCREYENDTLQCVAVLPNGRLRQILCAWISGVIMLIFITAPFMIRLALAGNFAALFSCVSGVIFIPSLALFLGEWTHTRRVFAGLFIVLAYLNLNYIPALMYFEIRSEYISFAHSFTFLAFGLVLGLAAILKRVRLIRA